MSGIRALQRWDKSDRELFFRAFLTLVVTLAASLVVLFVVILIMIRLLNGGHPYLSREIRDAIIIRIFGSTAAVMFFAFAVTAVRISRMVVVHIRRREGERLAKDMLLARDIQTGALPQKFPPYPDHWEFDVYASMRPARDVGGDFYDFYFARRDRLVFLVADVSGKGVPAALFMMRAKALLKSYVQTGIPLGEAVSKVNGILCEENTGGLFVTAWIAELDTMTGRLTYVNAGHNPPLRRRADALRADYLQEDPDLFLGAFSGVAYRVRELWLEPGESLYLYTDGITEQMDEEQELFGEQRLRGIVAGTHATQKALLDCVSRNVVRFGGAAEQTDDCTQLELLWRGQPARAVHEYLPTMEGLARAAADLECDLGDIPYETKMTILMAADEVFMNIVRHSGASKWSLTVEHGAFPSEIRLILSDDGKPFDPLSVREPDTSVALEDRKEGGLGIFIVRKTMSSVAYGRIDGRNVLTLGKVLDAPSEVVEIREKSLSERRIAARRK